MEGRSCRLCMTESVGLPMAGSISGDEEESQLISNRRLTICVVGSGGVGKSSLVTRYLHGHFPEVSQ